MAWLSHKAWELPGPDTLLLNIGMTLDFRNCNLLWTSVLVETLVRLGLRLAVVSPGSRSAPLAIACAAHPKVEAIPILDERSAAFFALGYAKRRQQPVVLICSSGTAGANMYPAIIEAQQSAVPLLVLTADRPPELHDCHAGQAIQQTHLFGVHANYYAELSLPTASLSALAYLRQTIANAWERTLLPRSGPVHLNCPFRDPLAPLPEPAIADLANQLDAESFFAHLQPWVEQPRLALQPGTITQAIAAMRSVERGLIIVGPAQPVAAVAFVQTVMAIADSLGWPVLTDALNPLRSHADADSSNN
ncbi:MAG: 2-succinyl-5-enolpyruvyl-6-hydroxy-3-cyclohexene-1-carboxylic-acid synthase, partial [Cyanobacteria bacterium P01_H01_bin.121]